MTGNEILKKAMELLGYTDSDGSAQLTQRIKSRALTAINQVYSDLHYALYSTQFAPIEKMSDKIELPPRIFTEVMPYGVASFLAQSESDGDQQQFMVMMYNQKRKLLCKITEIQDAMEV